MQIGLVLHASALIGQYRPGPLCPSRALIDQRNVRLTCGLNTKSAIVSGLQFRKGPYGRKHYIARLVQRQNRIHYFLHWLGGGPFGHWLFPYRVSQYGGAAFLIPYLFFVVVLGITGVIGEMAFGRAMGTGPMGAFSKALEMRGVKNGDKIFRVMCIIPVLGALGIAIGYAVVIGWFIKYLIEAACGKLVTQPDMAAFLARRRAFWQRWIPCGGACHYACRYGVRCVARH